MGDSFGGGMDVHDLFDNSNHSAPVPSGDLGSGKSEFASSGFDGSNGFGTSDPLFEYYLDGMRVWGATLRTPDRFNPPIIAGPDKPIGGGGGGGGGGGREWDGPLDGSGDWAGLPGSEAPVRECSNDQDLQLGQSLCTPSLVEIPLAEEIPQAGTGSLLAPSGEDRVHLLTRRAGSVARCDLIVLLHGRGGLPNNVKAIADDFARVGFDVISLQWSSGPTAFLSCDNPNVNLSDDDWNDCIEDSRDQKLNKPILGVLPALQFVLDELMSNPLTEGWSDYVKPDGSPNFERIIFAGYSEGANQSAFNSRQFNNPGLILMSGGGDAGTQNFGDPPPDPPLADWLFPEESPTPRHVGMRHLNETFSYQPGWDASGVPPSETFYRPSSVTTIADFNEADRLTRDDTLTSEMAHITTIEEDPAMSLARQYLACRAGGIL